MAATRTIDSDIRPISDLRNKFAEIADYVQGGRPVIFTRNGYGAKNVVADICSVKYPMKQDKSGLWKVTTPSLVPGFHYYSLEVDGARFADPVSESFYGCSMMSSAVEIPEPDTELFEIQDVPHGDIRLMNYYSEQTQEIDETVEGTFRQYPVRLAWAITIHKSQGLWLCWGTTIIRMPSQSVMSITKENFISTAH